MSCDAAACSTISGRMPTTRAASGGGPRWKSFASPAPPWEILLDIDQLAARGGRGLASELDDATLPGSCYPRAILSLSRGGSDAVTLREFDIDTKTFVADGFHVAGSQGRRGMARSPTRCCCRAPMARAWRRRSGYARTVRLWRRGTHVDQAPVIFETTADHMSGLLRRRRHRTLRRGYGLSTGSTSSTSVSGSATRPARTTKLDLPTDIWMRGASRLVRR